MPRADNVSRVADHFERAILAGELAPGTLLPSEREISAQMNVSRSVVREALGRLASAGLVCIRARSGARVEAPNSRPVTDGYQRLLSRSDFHLQDLAAVRLPLETAIAALAATQRTDVHLARLERTQDVLKNPRRSLEACVKADLDATGNPLFRVVLTPIQQFLIDSRRQTLGRHGALLAHEHHAKILRAVRAGDGDAASRAMREHIEANFQHLRQADADEERQRATSQVQPNNGSG
jgi:GntR family transcriptional repressor for pyruvate dehydrogenase complex